MNAWVNAWVNARVNALVGAVGVVDAVSVGGRVGGAVGVGGRSERGWTRGWARWAWVDAVSVGGRVGGRGGRGWTQVGSKGAGSELGIYNKPARTRRVAPRHAVVQRVGLTTCDVCRARAHEPLVLVWWRALAVAETACGKLLVIKSLSPPDGRSRAACSPMLCSNRAAVAART